MMKWLKMLNPVAQRDAERAFWAIMFLPEFTFRVRSELRNSTDGLTRAKVFRISQEVAMRVAKENFEAQEGFFSKVELMNAANNLDFSSRAIAHSVCRALDAGEIEQRVTNFLSESPFDKLMQAMFMANSNRAMQGAQDGHLKFNKNAVEQIIARNMMEMPF